MDNRRIDLEAKSDREVLLLTASTVNDMCLDVKALTEHVTKQNGRILTLENWRWFLTGSVVMLASGVLAQILGIIR